MVKDATWHSGLFTKYEPVCGHLLWGRYRCMLLKFFAAVPLMQFIQSEFDNLLSQAPELCVFLSYMTLSIQHLPCLKMHWYKNWCYSLCCYRCTLSTKPQAVESVWTVTSNNLQKGVDIWTILNAGTWCTIHLCGLCQATISHMSWELKHFLCWLSLLEETERATHLMSTWRALNLK